VRVELPTADDTRALGRALADVLEPGDLVVLGGPLGAGKTVLVQGIGAGLGVRARVTSPTFVLARVHADGRIPLVHVDAYRLGSVEEIDDLDLDADLADAVTVVEWGHGLVERLSDAHLLIRLDRPDDGRPADGRPDDGRPDDGRPDDGRPDDGRREGDGRRTAELVPSGGSWADRLGRLEPVLLSRS
jgi:tRNA threonylcarbamoyladenosine biosynthesis protein TsaE